MMITPERRHEPRVRTLNLVDVGEFNDAGLLMELTIGRTLDLSHDGTKLELSHPLKVGTEVTLDLEFGETILEVRGHVRSVHESGEESHRWVMGIEFFDLTDSDYETLHEYVELHTD